MARIKGPKKTNRYPDEFKVKAVLLANQSDILAKDVAENLGLHPILLYRWRKEYREGKFKVDKRKKKIPVERKKVTEIMRIHELERENQKLKIENEPLMVRMRMDQLK